VSCSSHVWQEKPELYLPNWKGRGRKPIRLRLRNPEQKSQRVDTLAQELPSDAWMQAKIKEGTKGPMVCDFAFLRIRFINVMVSLLAHTLKHTAMPAL
jgi:hypothetical protein